MNHLNGDIEDVDILDTILVIEDGIIDMEQDTGDIHMDLDIMDAIEIVIEEESAAK